MEDSTIQGITRPDLLTPALRYAARGIHVFPVRVAVNHLGHKQMSPGVLWRDASTTDAAMITAWFGHAGLYRDASVAIDVGKSGLVVIDPDGPEGIEAWALVRANAGETASTWRVATPGGGEHWYYRADPNAVVGNDQNGAVAEGVDVRGLGGFVIAPPSSDSRGAYRWLEGEPESVAALPTVPGIVVERMRAARGHADVKHERADFTSNTSNASSDPFGAPARVFSQEQASAFVGRELGAFRAMRTPEDHGFNGALNRLAVTYWHFVPEFVSYETAVGTMLEAAEFNRSVEYQGVDGVLATIHSGLRGPSSDRWKASRPSVGEWSSSADLGGVIGSPDGESKRVESEAVDLADVLLGRMLDRDALDSLPAPTPLIRDVLDLDSESWIIGASGGFKSFVALDWACHVGLGRTWRGKDVERGRVVYVVAEGKKGIPLRVKAWESMYGQRIENVLFLPEPVQVANPAAWAALVEACKRVGPALIVLDTQARITVGLEENSTTAMMLLVDAVSRLRAATGACVLVVHHTGRDGGDARGSSAIDGAQDTELRVERPKSRQGREDLVATISTDKQKDGDESVSFEIQLRKVDLGTDEVTGRPLSSLALIPLDPFAPEVHKRPAPDWTVNLTENQGDVMAAMRDHSDRFGATRAQAMRWVKDHRDHYQRPAMPAGSFDSAVRDLVAKELLVRTKGPRLVLADLYEDDE